MRIDLSSRLEQHGKLAEADVTSCRVDGPGAACSDWGGGAGDSGDSGDMSDAGDLGDVSNASDAGASSGISDAMCTPPDAAGASTCTVCELQGCCAARAACENNPACPAFQRCSNACGMGLPDDGGVDEGGADDAGAPDGSALSCDEYCLARHPTGLTEYAPLMACMVFHCAVACGGTVDPCFACAIGQCAIEETASSGTPDGYLFSDCVSGCPVSVDTACTSACASQFPSVSSAELNLEECANAHCAVCVGGDP